MPNLGTRFFAPLALALPLAIVPAAAEPVRLRFATTQEAAAVSAAERLGAALASRAAGRAVIVPPATQRAPAPTPTPTQAPPTGTAPTGDAPRSEAGSGSPAALPVATKSGDPRFAVRTGQAEIGDIASSEFMRFSPLLAADRVPLLVRSVADARRLYAAQKPLIEARFAEDGLVLLYSLPGRPLRIATSRRIATMADFQGLKLLADDAAALRLAELLGGTGVAVPRDEVAAAFAVGRISAVLWPDGSTPRPPGTTLAPLVQLPRRIGFMSAAALAALPGDVQEAVRQAAREIETAAWAELDALPAEATQALTPDVEAALWAIGAQLADEWATGAGADGFTMLQNFRSGGAGP